VTCDALWAVSPGKSRCVSLENGWPNGRDDPGEENGIAVGSYHYQRPGNPDDSPWIRDVPRVSSKTVERELPQTRRDCGASPSAAAAGDP